MGSEPIDIDWEKRIWESQELDLGDTNKLYLTDDGNLIKVFQGFSLPVLVQSMGYLLAGKWRYQGAERRAKNELSLREKLEGGGINFPEVIRSEGKYLEVEYIEGETVRDILVSNPDKAKEFGERIGDLLDDIHSKDAALVDFKLENVMVYENSLYLLDCEFGQAEATGFDRFVGQLTLIMDLRTLPPRIYSEFLEGFRSRTRVYRSSKLMSVPYALGLALFVRRDLRMFYSVLRNLF